MQSTAVDPITQLRSKWQQPYFRYLVVISVLGAGTVVGGLFHVGDVKTTGGFLLFLLLAIIAHIGTFNVAMPHANINYTVAPAVSMAVMWLEGFWLAALVEAISMLAMWLIKARSQDRWKKTVEQLAFNAFVGSLTIFIAGICFYSIRAVSDDNLFLMLLGWLVAGILYDQLNLWLVIGVIYLSTDRGVRPGEVWKAHWWASSLNVLVLILGGGVLAYAGSQFGWSGILVFFLPVLLSAYAFRLYVQQMQDHMDNLESIIAARTNELKNANNALQHLNVEKNAFLAILAHDMKAPLTAIRGYGQLLKLAPQRLVDRPDIVDTILSSQEMLLEIVNNIVDLEKLQSDNPEMALQLRSVELVQFLDTAMEMIAIQADRSEISVDLETDVHFLKIVADEAQMRRAIMNLLTNAIKYTPEGGSVSVRTVTTSETVTIEVHDTGYGIPVEDIEFIFDRFRRVQKHKFRAAGTGLGLAITKAIIEAHHGTISVESEENVGSVFRVTLPLQQEPTVSEETDTA